MRVHYIYFAHDGCGALVPVSAALRSGARHAPAGVVNIAGWMLSGKGVVMLVFDVPPPARVSEWMPEAGTLLTSDRAQSAGL